MPTFTPALVRALRERAHLSREQLGVRTGKTGSTIHKIETGAIRPSLSTLAAMAAELSCGVQEFFVERDPNLTAFADEPEGTELGHEMDAWVRSVRMNMPPMTQEVARRVSAMMFPTSAPPRTRTASS